MHNKKKEVRFGKRANKYDRGIEGKFLNKFYNSMMEFVDLKQNDNILDVACGTGEILLRIYNKCTVNGYGIDIDEKMIEVAKEKCPGMDITVGSCEKLPYDRNKFDEITVCMAYHHFENKAAFAQEANRVLKKNGNLYIAELRLPSHIKKIVNGLMKHFNVIGRFYSIDEITEIFKQFGFVYNGSMKNGRVQIVKLRKTS